MQSLTVTEALSALPVRRTAWVIGKPKFNFTKYKLWTATCQDCNCSLDIPPEWVFECSSCGSANGFELRSNVPIQLTEGENMLLVTLKSPDVELLTKVTPQILKDSHEFGFDAQDDLKAAFEKLTVVCFLRSKKKKNKEGEASEQVRYISVKAYDATAIGIAASFSSPTKEDVVKDNASSEKQLFTPTFGNLVDEIDAQQDHAEHSDRPLSAKRNIDFVSETGTSDDGAKATHQESTSTAADMHLATTKGDGGSPLKKTKDKLKQN